MPSFPRDIKGQIVLRFETLEDQYEGKTKPRFTEAIAHLTNNWRKFRSQTEKQRWEESEKRRAEERRSEKRKTEKKECAGAPEGSKVAKHCVFSMICGSRGSKSRLAKAAGCGAM